MTPDEACTYPIDLETHYGYIYCLTFPNGKKYVGQSKRPWKQRWHGHKSPNSDCVALRQALQKYQPCNTHWEILSYAKDLIELNQLESHFIKILHTLSPNGYNLTTGGDSNEHSLYSKRKQQISMALYTLKKNKPEATREDALDYILARNQLVEDQLDTGFNVISYITSNTNSILLNSGAFESREYFKDLWLTDNKIEEREALRDKLSKTQRDLSGRPVCCVETGETFSCAPEAAEKHPEWIKNKICACCKGTRKSHKGLHFYYTDISKEEFERLKAFWESPFQIPESTIMSRKAVMCKETGKAYESLREAATAVFNIEDKKIAKDIATQIGRVCSGQRKQYKGFHFTYVQ